MSFDPYYEWFRINPKLRVGDAPPDHYALLGLHRYEADPNLIHGAALQRMKELRLRQTGAHADLTQRLMNEVSQARLCLADPARKSQYDFELQQRFRSVPPPLPQTNSGTSVWLMTLAVLLIVGGGAVTYFAIMRPTELGEQVAKPRQDPAKETSNEPTQPEPERAPVVVEKKKEEEPKKEAEPDSKPPAKQPEERPALVKLRDLTAIKETKSEDGNVIHMAAIATDNDEEAPTFLDRDGLLLGFQRKSGGKWQFIAVKRASIEEPFTTEHLVQGLPDGVRLQGFVLEPGELSCLCATSDGQSLLQAKRPNKNAAWGMGQPLASENGLVKASWPTLTADGKDLYCVQQRSGKQWILWLTRPSVDEQFSAPVVLDIFGNSMTQPAVSPDGKTMVLRGPEFLYVSHRDDESTWSPPEPVLPLRATAGANRDLLVSPCFSPDGKSLLFSSNRDGGVGGFDLWSAPVSALKVETPNLIDLAEKNSAKKKPSTTEKTKSKVADASKKPAKKGAPAPTATSGAPVKEAISEWLVLGPIPAAPREKIRTVADLAALEGAEILRKMPKEAQKEKSGLVWKRTDKFDAVGVYSVAVSIRLKSNQEAKLVVVSAPGGGMLWLDGPLGELSWGGSRPWTVLNEKVKSDALTLPAGRHKLVGTICVADPSVPVVVRLISAEDGSTIDGVSVAF
jgi:hypothetical protein